MISTGLLDDAKAYALRNVELLYPYVQAGIKVVGIEPSCVLTFRDDYLELLPDYDKAIAVADGSVISMYLESAGTVLSILSSTYSTSVN